MSRRTVSTDAELGQALYEIEGFFDAPPVPGSKEAGVSETLCMRASPCKFGGSFVEPFWI